MEFIKKYKLGILGVLVGGILGYAYYHFIGCNSGTCAITSKPVNSSVYGMVMGYLIFTTFEKTKEKKINMFGFLKNLFGGTSVDYAELVKNGAQIIDVRTPAEFNGGHIKGAKNIPLQSLNQNLGKINKNKPVITCCASGARSAAAKSILQNSGFSEVYNGGGWQSLKSKIS